MLLSQKLLCDQLKKYQSDSAAHPGWLSPVPPLLSHRLPITPHPPFLGLGALSLPVSGPLWVLPSPAVVFFHMNMVACGSVVCWDSLLTYLNLCVYLKTGVFLCE